MHRNQNQYNPITWLCQVIILLIFYFSLIAPKGISASELHKNQNYWILFNQKNSVQPLIMTDRAYDRRSRRAVSSDLSWYDLPVDDSYLMALQDHGATIRFISRWLNAVSVTVDDSTLLFMQQLPFVQRIIPVAYYTKPLPSMFSENIVSLGKVTTFDYGPSLGQITMLKVDSLHSAGLSGHGILVGMMDTGFDTNHPVFARMDSLHQILITHDFINGDSNVVDGFDIQRSHGTSTLSVLGGFSPGNLIGPAFGANFVLAKTEIFTQEIQAEEDNWVAASEWMESLGVDIISSSLGYIDWYDTTQLDGRTALITRAANIANSLGVVVVNSAGNEGTNPEWRKITPPADGFSVIAVGAVDANEVIVNFSSRGPTADGRIKPDVCALGSGDYVANYINNGYAFESGTSFSAPLIAGSVALLLEAHPDWDPIIVNSILKRSSSQASNPDNDYGWGIPNMVDAYYGGPSQLPVPLQSLLKPNYPNPFNKFTFIEFGVPRAEHVILEIFDLLGRKVGNPIDAELPAGRYYYEWHGGDQSSGIYFYTLKTDDFKQTRKMILLK
jgi:serine protease AprX